MRYVIYQIDNEYLKRYMDDNNCPRNRVSLSFIKREGSKLFETNDKDKFENMMEFYWSRYTSSISSVVAYDTEDESYIEW